MQTEDFDLIVKEQTESVSIHEIESNLNIKFKQKSKLTSLVKASELKIDMSYQREVNQNKVNLIVKNYNENAIGVVTLSYRENGDLYIIDGSHRVEALKIMGKGNNDLNAIVFLDLSVQDEADLYITINENRTKPKKADLHKAGISSGNPDSVAIDAMLRSHNLSVENRPGDGVIRAIDTLYKVNSKVGINNLNNVIKVLKEANGTNSTAFQAEYLTAVATIIVNYKLVNLTRLASCIASLGDPTNVIAKAKSSSRGSTPFANNIALCLMIIDSYNYRLRASKLNSIVVLSLDARNYLQGVE